MPVFRFEVLSDSGIFSYPPNNPGDEIQNLGGVEGKVTHLPIPVFTFEKGVKTLFHGGQDFGKICRSHGMFVQQIQQASPEIISGVLDPFVDMFGVRRRVDATRLSDSPGFFQQGFLVDHLPDYFPEGFLVTQIFTETYKEEDDRKCPQGLYGGGQKGQTPDCRARLWLEPENERDSREA